MTDSPYEISSSTDGTGVRIALSGEFDLEVRDELSEAVLTAVKSAGPGGVTIDFAGAAFIESEAMGALIEGLNAARESGKPFIAVNARGLVLRVLDVSGVLALFDQEAR